MKSKFRFLIVGSLIVLGVLTGWIIPSSAAAIFGEPVSFCVHQIQAFAA